MARRFSQPACAFSQRLAPSVSSFLLLCSGYLPSGHLALGILKSDGLLEVHHSVTDLFADLFPRVSPRIQFCAHKMSETLEKSVEIEFS